MVEFLKYISLVKVVAQGSRCVELLKLPNLQTILKIRSGSAGRQRKGFSQKREKKGNRREDKRPTGQIW